MTIIPDPEDYRINVPAARYRANPITGADRTDIEAALREINEHSAVAAQNDGGGLPPEIELIIVSRTDATDELYVRVFEHGLLEDAQVLLKPLPDVLAQGSAPGSLVETFSDVVEAHSEFQGIEQNQKALVRHSDLANGLVEATDRLLTIRPASGLQPTTEDRSSMSSISHLRDADWEIRAGQTVNELDWTYDRDDHPEQGLVQEVMESVEQLDADVVCQIHLEASYAVDGEPVTASRAANVADTFDADADIESSEEYGFGFRLFVLSNADPEPNAELDDQLKSLGKALAPRFPERYTPALDTGGSAVTHHIERCFLGRGLQQSENHDLVYRRHLEALSDWLDLPQRDSWYAAGRFLPVEQQYLAECTDGESRSGKYPLGRDPMLHHQVTTPGLDPRRHVIYSDSPARRRKLLSKYIDISRQAREGPVIALDWSGDLAAAYFDQYTADEQEDILGKHARIDIAEMPLATSPRRFSAGDTLVDTATSSCSVEEAKELYSTLLSHDSGEIEPDPRNHFEAVFDALDRLDSASLSHPEFVAELEGHSPQGAERVAEESDARYAAATTEWFRCLHDELPADLFGDLDALFDLEQDVPDEGVIWLDLSGMEAGQTMAGTILLDAIARHVPSSSDSGVAATVVFDRAEYTPLTGTTEDAIPISSDEVSEEGGLAAVVGARVGSSAPGTGTPLQQGAVKTVDTRAVTDTSEHSTALPGQRRKVEHQHGTDQSLVVIPPKLRPGARRRKELAPLLNPTSNDDAESEIDIQRLRQQGLPLTPTAVPEETFLEADHDPGAVHPSRLSSLFTKESPQDTKSSSRPENQPSLGNYSMDVASDETACAVCGTRYNSVTNALLCHPDALHTMPAVDFEAQADGSGMQSSTETRGIGYPRPFIERIDFEHNDELTAFIKTLLSSPDQVNGLDEILSCLQEGLVARLDGEEYEDISLDILQFLQACELMRVGALPFDAGSMIPLRDRCLDDTTIDDLAEYVEEKRTPEGKYYKLKNLAENLSPISTLHTDSATPTTPGLDEPYPAAWGRQTLAARFADKREVTETEIIHHPGSELGDTFPIDLVDVVAFDEVGRITNVGLVVSPATMESRVTSKMIEWVAEIPAEVTLVVEGDEVARYIASELSSTEYLTLNRADHLTPLPETDYRTSKISTWMTWAAGSDITLESLSSLTE